MAQHRTPINALCGTKDHQRPNIEDVTTEVITISYCVELEQTLQQYNTTTSHVQASTHTHALFTQKEKESTKTIDYEDIRDDKITRQDAISLLSR